ncbi:MAG: hypothetical protein ACTSRH_06985 [Promethearchaeota archaeon]
MTSNITIGLDQSHNNMLTLEASSYSEFTHFLFASGYKIVRIENGFLDKEKLNDYSLIIISTPTNAKLKEEEINNLEEYVKNGGSLLIVSSRGGDIVNRTNLNELTRKFSFEFSADEIFDSVNYINLQKRPIIDNFKPHSITEQITKIVFSNACSINVLELADIDENIKLDVLARGGLYCWRKVYEKGDWIEEDSPKIPLMVAVKYHEGKVVGFGSLSIFSSLGTEYGFSVFDNNIIIASILSWLILDVHSERKVITIELQRDLFHWIDSIVKKDNWDNFSDLINVSLKYFKDHYKEIIHQFKEKKKELQKRLEKRSTKEVEEKEENVIEKVPIGNSINLDEILKAIENVMEGKEGSPESDNVQEEDLERAKEIKEMLEKLPQDLNSLTVKQLKAFCKKHEIALPRNAKKSEIIDTLKYVLGIK